MIEHWVHLRCAGICLAQYTDTWTLPSTRVIQSHNSHRHNTTPPFQTLYQAHHRNQNTDTRPTLHCSHMIGKAHIHYSHPITPPPLLLRHPELNTYAFHTLHQLLSSHAPHYIIYARHNT